MISSVESSPSSDKMSIRKTVNRWSLRKSFLATGANNSNPSKYSIRSKSSNVLVRRLQDCVHFHYEPTSAPFDSLSCFEATILRSHLHHHLKSHRHHHHRHNNGPFKVLISNTQTNQQWIVERTQDDLKFLDAYIHSCCIKRSVSNLYETEKHTLSADDVDQYLKRLSSIMDARFCCSSVLNWFQIDNRGNRIVPSSDHSSPVNIPAKAAATAIRSYKSTSNDELSFEQGTMISVIEMPPPIESVWWRGKKVNNDKGAIEVGYFPSDYVRLIGNQNHCDQNVSSSNQSSVSSSSYRHEQCQLVLPDSSSSKQQQKSSGMVAKHGKLITFLRTFFSNRPSRIALKQAGIVKERVFGCDLGEHLHNLGCKVPKVVEICCEFIERYGIVDGIYRLNGSFHNIQKLRQMFDEHQSNPMIETTGKNGYINDVYAVGSVLKMYFRELPNPLLTFYLYKRFMSLSYLHCSTLEYGKCVPGTRHNNHIGFLRQIRELVRQLPPPNQETLSYLMKHLNYLSKQHSWKTNMTSKNLAIVWAPNLLKPMTGSSGQATDLPSDQLELIQLIALLTEQLIEHWPFIFASDMHDFDDRHYFDEASVEQHQSNENLITISQKRTIIKRFL